MFLFFLSLSAAAEAHCFEARKLSTAAAAEEEEAAAAAAYVSQFGPPQRARRQVGWLNHGWGADKKPSLATGAAAVLLVSVAAVAKSSARERPLKDPAHRAARACVKRAAASDGEIRSRSSHIGRKRTDWRQHSNFGPPPAAKVAQKAIFLAA